jgi:hypothetical protein
VAHGRALPETMMPRAHRRRSRRHQCARQLRSVAAEIAAGTSRVLGVMHPLGELGLPVALGYLRVTDRATGRPAGSGLFWIGRASPLKCGGGRGRLKDLIRGRNAKLEEST